MKNVKGKYEEITFTIYTKQEAIDGGISFCDDWRDCRPGDWGITDDGFVLQCRSFKEFVGTRRNRRGDTVRKDHLLKRFYKFAVGEPILEVNTKTGKTQKPKFEFLPFLRNGGYSHPRGKSWHESECGKSRAKNAIALYTHLYILRKGQLTYDDWGNVGAVYRPDDNYNVLNFKSLLKSESGQRAFMTELKKALSDSGVTYESLLTSMNETYSLARDNVHTQVMRGIIQDKLKMLEKADGTAIEDNTDYDLQLLSQQMEFTALGPEINSIVDTDFVEVNDG